MAENLNRRTSAEVLAARANHGGCCDRFADNMGCDCLSTAATESTPDLAEENRKLRAAIAKHHGQRADDRCFLDDDELYAAAGLPPADVRVGDKAAMLKNCERFIDRRCSGGGWPSYADLEAEIVKLQKQIEGHADRIAKQSDLLSRQAEKPPENVDYDND